MTDPTRPRPSLGAELHDRATRVLSVAMAVIGVALAARLTVLSVLLGLLFLAAGLGRLYAGVRLRRRRDAAER